MTGNGRIAKTQSDRNARIRTTADRARVSPVLAFSCFWLLCIGLVAGGCATGTSREERDFILEAARQGEPLRPIAEGSLEVHRFSVDAEYAGKNLVYRIGEFEYEVDYYRQFLIAPGAMITERTRDWLADSGLFSQVLPLGSRIAPDYTLEGNVTALYGDFAKGSAPAAVMEIRLFLLDNTGGTEKVAFAETYRSATPVTERTAEVFVQALNQSLVDILGRFERDVQKTFPGAASTTGGDQP
jgi:cholesterol transport system auxiliary component